MGKITEQEASALLIATNPGGTRAYVERRTNGFLTSIANGYNKRGNVVTAGILSCCVTAFAGMAVASLFTDGGGVVIGWFGASIPTLAATGGITTRMHRRTNRSITAQLEKLPREIVEQIGQGARELDAAELSDKTDSVKDASKSGPSQGDLKHAASDLAEIAGARVASGESYEVVVDRDLLVRASAAIMDAADSAADEDPEIDRLSLALAVASAREEIAKQFPQLCVTLDLGRTDVLTESRAVRVSLERRIADLRGHVATPVDLTETTSARALEFAGLGREVGLTL